MATNIWLINHFWGGIAQLTIVLKPIYMIYLSLAKVCMRS
ncbi:hypothetical protein DSUL_50429 [Desulfovibrionales bacterium]